MDYINIKLAKSAGIHDALKINATCEAAGVKCMLGGMSGVIDWRERRRRLNLRLPEHHPGRFGFALPLYRKPDPGRGGFSS